MHIVQKIEEALSRSVCGGWDRDYLVSIHAQIARGAKLSAKQNQILGQVLARNTEEDNSNHANWALVYADEYATDANILARYHQHQPYYRALARDIITGRVPERSKFLRMYNNKYSKKVLSLHNSEPKYAVGDYLEARMTIDLHKNVDFTCDMLWSEQNKVALNFRKRGGFVVAIMSDIRSAASGAKRYKLLPVGETKPIIVEERFLKPAKKKK